jgi:hypothetical protein
MDQEYLLKAVHDEFANRMIEEDRRQNARLDALERGLQEIGKITANVEVLAANISAMTAEIKRQGERIESIEEKPVKRWDAVVTGIIGAIVGALGAALMSGVIK